VKKKMKIIVVSCDRYYEDGDDSFWKQLAANEDDASLASTDFNVKTKLPQQLALGTKTH
jgi:hypothetical protein